MTNDINNDDLAILSTTFDVNQSDVEASFRSAGTSLSDFQEARRRLVNSDVDAFKNPRPDEYGNGWSTATDDVESNDDNIEAGQDLSLADLLESADKLIAELQGFKRREFLKADRIDNSLRNYLAEMWGRSTCLSSAIEISEVDNDMTSQELAEALRENDSYQAVRSFITDLESIIEADRLQYVMSGGKL